MLRLQPAPLLQLQRNLYDLPLGLDRFRAYLATMTDGADDIGLPPLVAINPMGKPHVAARLDALLAQDAEGIAARALALAGSRLEGVEATVRVGLAVADDARGGWTDRYLYEAKHRFGKEYLPEPGSDGVRWAWATVLLWSSEAPDDDAIAAETLSSLYRTLYKLRFGAPGTLAATMWQEGLAAAFAGATPTLAGDDLELVALELEPWLDRGDFATLFPLMYGDPPAERAGIPTRGLPLRAGFELGLVEVLKGGLSPERALLTEGDPQAHPYLGSGL